MLLIYIGFQVIYFYCFPSSFSPSYSPISSLFLLFFPPPSAPNPPPHFYCFPCSSSSSSFLLSFPPPHFYLSSFLSSSSSFYCFLSFTHSFRFFFSTRSCKRLPTAIISSFGSNVSCSKQQSWFSSAGS